MQSIKEFLYKVVTSGSGVSSKRVIGGVCYLLLTVSMIVLSFVNPEFSGISEILMTLIITTASLLGITTFENINSGKQVNKIRDNEDLKNKD